MIRSAYGHIWMEKCWLRFCLRKWFAWQKFFPPESISAYVNYSIWREVHFLYFLFIRALLPAEFSLRFVLKNWDKVKLKLAERTRKRISVSARLKYITSLKWLARMGDWPSGAIRKWPAPSLWPVMIRKGRLNLWVITWSHETWKRTALDRISRHDIWVVACSSLWKT